MVVPEPGAGSLAMVAAQHPVEAELLAMPVLAVGSPAMAATRHRAAGSRAMVGTPGAAELPGAGSREVARGRQLEAPFTTLQLA
jgi:hypothetical protein